MCNQIIINNLLVILLIISAIVTLIFLYIEENKSTNIMSYISFIIFLILSITIFVLNLFFRINRIIFNVNSDNNYATAA
jgi:membrane protein YdbS with pleckstrin-like domain